MFWILKGFEYLILKFKHHQMYWFWIHLLKILILICFNVKKIKIKTFGNSGSSNLNRKIQIPKIQQVFFFRFLKFK